jgi:hypothetical protein
MVLFRNVKLIVSMLFLASLLLGCISAGLSFGFGGNSNRQGGSKRQSAVAYFNEYAARDYCVAGCIMFRSTVYGAHAFASVVGHDSNRSGLPMWCCDTASQHGRVCLEFDFGWNSSSMDERSRCTRNTPGVGYGRIARVIQRMCVSECEQSLSLWTKFEHYVSSKVDQMGVALGSFGDAIGGRFSSFLASTGALLHYGGLYAARGARFVVRQGGDLLYALVTIRLDPLMVFAIVAISMALVLALLLVVLDRYQANRYVVNYPVVGALVRDVDGVAEVGEFLPEVPTMNLPIVIEKSIIPGVCRVGTLLSEEGVEHVNAFGHATLIKLPDHLRGGFLDSSTGLVFTHHQFAVRDQMDLLIIGSNDKQIRLTKDIVEVLIDIADPLYDTVVLRVPDSFSAVLGVKRASIHTGALNDGHSVVMNYHLGDWNFATGTLERVAKSNYVHHTISTAPGCSGGGLFVKRNNAWMLYAIHLGGHQHTQRNRANILIGLTKPVVRAGGYVSETPYQQGLEQDTAWEHYWTRQMKRGARDYYDHDFDDDVYVPDQNYDDDESDDDKYHYGHEVPVGSGHQAPVVREYLLKPVVAKIAPPPSDRVSRVRARRDIAVVASSKDVPEPPAKRLPDAPERPSHLSRVKVRKDLATVASSKVVPKPPRLPLEAKEETSEYIAENGNSFRLPPPQQGGLRQLESCIAGPSSVTPPLMVEESVPAATSRTSKVKGAANVRKKVSSSSASKRKKKRNQRA